MLCCYFGVSFISLLCIRIVLLFKFLIVSVTKWIVFTSKFKSNARTIHKTICRPNRGGKKSKDIKILLAYIFCLLLFFDWINYYYGHTLLISWAMRCNCRIACLIYLHIISSSPPTPPSSPSFFFHSASVISMRNSAYLI